MNMRKKNSTRRRKRKRNEEEVTCDVCSHLLFQPVNQLLQPVDLHRPLVVLIVNPCWRQRELQLRLSETRRNKVARARTRRNNASLAGFSLADAA